MAKKEAAHEEPKQETEEGTSDAGARLVRKLSPKTLLGNLKSMTALMTVNNIKERALYRVMGVSHGVKHGTGDNGPWVAFLGSFEALIYETGEIVQSVQCFVPKAVEDVMVASLMAGKKQDSESSIQFAIEVGIKLTDTTVGYEFTVKNLVKTQNADPLAGLRVALPPAPKVAALPAPAKV